MYSIIIHNVFERNFSFYMSQLPKRKNQFLFIASVWLVLEESSILAGRLDISL